jgi:carboxyl-terminal processing protease
LGRIAASVVVLLAVLAGGLWLGGHPAKLPSAVSEVFVDGNAGLNVEATEAIEENYFREVSPDELTNSSLQGMVRGLRRRYKDRFSDYFSPESLAKFNEEISGKFSGIGLSVIPVKRGLGVSQVFKGSPADKAGIRVGEIIVSVEGKSIAGIDSEVATAKIKGPEGTSVKIGVLDPRRVRPGSCRSPAPRSRCRSRPAASSASTGASWAM